MPVDPMPDRAPAHAAERLQLVAPPFHVQSTARQQRDGFPYFAFHESVAALLSRKWRELCVAGL